MRYNYIKILAVAAGICMITSFTAFGGEFGSISQISDDVVADGDSGLVTTKITGITGMDGTLALPLYEDAVLKEALAESGTLKGMPEEVTYGDTSYLLAQFDERETEVSLTLHWTQEQTYEMKTAKTSGTAPGGLKAIKYDMVNSAPIEIGNYELHFSVPEGYELDSIKGYDPEEEYSIYMENGRKYGSYVFGEVPTGGESSMTINVKPAGGRLTLIMWAITAIVSAFFLYKNREMLVEAAELSKKKKAEKQGGKAL